MIFAHCKDQDEMWVPLVEKAFAKLNGGYERIARWVVVLLLLLLLFLLLLLLLFGEISLFIAVRSARECPI
jgi:hypothetical protein